MAGPDGEAIRLDDQVSWREVDGEIVALHLRSSTYFSTNATGAYLWQLIVDGTTREALATRLAAQFDIPLARAVDDIEKFLRLLSENGLLQDEK